MATVDTWIAAKKLTQCNASTTPFASRRTSKGARSPARTRRMPSAIAAIAVRPRTMATGERTSHLPNRPANAKSATAACSATSAAAFVIAGVEVRSASPRIVPSGAATHCLR